MLTTRLSRHRSLLIAYCRSQTNILVFVSLVSELRGVAHAPETFTGTLDKFLHLILIELYARCKRNLHFAWNTAVFYRGVKASRSARPRGQIMWPRPHNGWPRPHSVVASASCILASWPRIFFALCTTSYVLIGEPMPS